jgi:DNA polymerase III sliding clamp (beta) subunit (PCNA family)
MKIKSTVLAEKLRRLSPAIANTGKNPILENILIKDGKISATNTMLTIIGNIDTEETLILPFKPLQNILAEVGDEDVIISQNKKETILKAGKDVFGLGKPFDIDNYPTPVSTEYAVRMMVGSLFFTAMKDASKHESPDEHLTINGINISTVEDSIEIAGTDGRTIFVATFPSGGANVSAHIHSSFCKAIENFNVAKLSFSEKFLSCIVKDYDIRIQLLETKYPNYASFMPKEVEINCTINRKELEAGIRKCLVFNGDIKSITMTFAEDSILLEYNDAEANNRTQVIIPAVHEIEGGYKIAVSATYLQRALASISAEAENVLFSIPDSPEKPVFIQEEHVLILIVPMLIQN